MAHIPYGYRIRNGRAEADPEDARRWMTFTEYYLEGMSIHAANKKAATGRCDDSMRRGLRNRVYLGDGYYPQLISKERFQRIMEELEKRTHPPTRSADPGTDVKTKFRLRHPECGFERRTGEPTEKAGGKSQNNRDPVRLAQYVYSLIEPAENGNRKMTEDELAGIRKWSKEILFGKA